jgi:hypothetical protein
MKRLGHLSRDARCKCALKAGEAARISPYVSQMPLGDFGNRHSTSFNSDERAMLKHMAVAGAHRNGISIPKNKGFCNPVACDTEPVVVVMTRGGRILPAVSIELREGEVGGTI